LITLGTSDANSCQFYCRPGIRCSTRRLPNVSNQKDHRLQELDETIVGDSQVIRDLKNVILRAADSDSTVLITVESGTGKELIARSIHDFSPRRNEPFSAVNCGALTESLLESELFGHVKGAFTGANTYKKGLFEAAGKGTIFLDEFGEMSSLMQVRLLRVLQQRRVRPVGSEESKEIEIHARVVVATNRNLKRDIAEGRFRQDLYYRVNVFPIRSPALRNRIEDLPVLIDRILKKLHANCRLAVSLRFDTAALRLLSDYSWPGNVRELENVIERLANNTMKIGVVSAADVKIDLKHNGWSEPDGETHEIILSKGLKCLNDGSVAVRHLSRRDELELYLKALDESEGDFSKAARRLGIKRTTLYMRIKRMQHNLDRDAIT
jgi:transcriptional regulator with PAS, ATPase and Fis domain